MLIGALVGAAISGWQGHRFRFTIERGPRVTDGQRLALAFAGGFIAACGAKLANGCTSGAAPSSTSEAWCSCSPSLRSRLRAGLLRQEGVAVMMFPLASSIEFSVGAELAIALALGIGFGFVLERAGFGSARKLTAVFYLYDMAVVKVMFSAVVTTMVGVFALSAIGLLDLTQLYVEPTNLVAQLVGGLLFGAGFLIGGYCPGTSMAAIATGRKDGMVFALGMLACLCVRRVHAPTR